VGWKRSGPAGTAAVAAWPCDQPGFGKRAFLLPAASPGPRDLRCGKARAPSPEGRAGRNCTPTRRMHTVFDFAATRPAHLARAPRHRGRALPSGATRRVEVNAMGVVDVAEAPSESFRPI